MNKSPINIINSNLQSLKKDKRFHHILDKLPYVLDILKNKNPEYEFDLQQHVMQYWENNKNQFIAAKQKLDSKNITKLIVIADGESYLLTKALYQAFYNSNNTNKPEIELIFTQGNISPEELVMQLQNCGDELFAINYISKSGISLESAISFREFRKKLLDNIKKAGLDPITAVDLIYITTDSHENTLTKMVDLQKYTLFQMTSELPARFSSIFEATTLFPLYISGVNISEILSSYLDMYQNLITQEVENNQILLNAAYLCYLNKYMNKNILEFIVNDEILLSFSEYIKDLTNTTINRNQKGYTSYNEIYDTSFDTKDDFTVKFLINQVKDNVKVNIDIDLQHYDVLNFLGKRHEINIEDDLLEENNNQIDLSVFDIVLQYNDFSEKTLAALVLTLQGIIITLGFLEEIDPFTQPGVEVYKRNLYNLIIK
ncbi:hypothetical protein [Mycoplasma seminis]|uniref:Glucose-6-phosphate isomerase n=1 Tax=Mycoplasma seminis TaxID=512749 RepID=A0ABY9HAW8_9MOLU|nr:hypothetical protein [Mycoplasma seminis]WLP85742.1 hypothetical protein Q8852_01130 [Mycoplasma seminis]